jgi:hypothetical protein
MFICKRCHYQTDVKANLITHFKRKNVCQPKHSDIDIEDLINEFDKKDRNILICRFCGKVFKYQSGTSRHEKKCKETQDNVNTLDILNERINDLENKLKERATHITNVTNNINIQTQNNVQNNVQNNTINFGKENVEFLADSFIRRCLFRAPDGVTDLTKKIHFNPEKPEYHNVTTTNKKDGFLEVFKNGKWVYDDKNKVLDSLIKQSFDIISSHYDQFDDEIKAELSPTNFKRVDRFVESVLNQDKTIQNSLRKCLYLLILNNRHMVNKE